MLQMCQKTLQDHCFLPRYERARKQDGKWVNVEKPLFPGYVFFDSDNVEELLEGLKKIPKFTKVLGNGGSPIALYPYEVAFLEKYTNENKVMEMSRGFIERDQLVVTEGSLKDYKGKVIHVN